MSESRGNDNQGSLDGANLLLRARMTIQLGRMIRVACRVRIGAFYNSSLQQSPDLGEVERERVRQIVWGWMESGISVQNLLLCQGMALLGLNGLGKRSLRG
ncbi:unnamed protein product [Fraxinus pennsylvanica]|uniref:Uncharacterized protein n=1 Tax=Fraxinus pennsylvanica TaxID=56036 RepID=A0AAD2A364_9LAMI|nr:unnamed protein product [Fraxinus pennsylvanica]